MNKEIIRSEKLREEYVKIQHPSGLTMLLCPMEGFSTSYAMFTTKYGSVDSCFKTNLEPDYFEIPAGTAHYLEHKMFEQEDGDAFGRFAQIGASPNAFTTFDKTAYLFACSDGFKESLEILLDFVSTPYFTPETVAKEQGIIGQEIGMYDDSAESRVFFNLLSALYVNHPVRLDIAGSVESIAEITDKTLYRVYNTFYHLSNMVLTIAGNFSVEDVLEVADKVLKKGVDIEIIRKTPEEPKHIAKAYVEQNMPVATPLFCIGFKGSDAGNRKNFENMILDEMIIDLVCGEMTPLYRSLYEDGLINNGLNGEVMASRDYICTIIEGESRDPKEVQRRLLSEIEKLQRSGFDNELFERCKKATYGRYIGLYSKPETVASVLVSTYFAEMTLYELLDLVAGVSKEQLEARLRENLQSDCCALSVVSVQPMEV